MILTLLDIPDMMGVLKGVVMEVVDCALPLVQEIIPTTDPAVAFKDIDAAFLVGAMPRKPGMERKDLLSTNVKIFKLQGEALNEHAKKTAKIVVVGNPANTNTMICAKYAPSIPRENFTAMTRLDQNRAQAQIASRLNVVADKVKNVISWGNHSATLYPDVANGTVTMGKDKPTSIEAAINNNEWLSTEFVQKVQKRGAEVIAARKLSSAMSAAKAASDQMHDIWYGTKPGEYISLGVISDGSYGMPKDIVFSFPVTIKNKQWNIVKNLNVSAFAQEKLALSAKELEDERDEALAICAKM
ncbi:malate dehydrogenase, cytoplasmic [Anabrus simplex]|uniref:malate dehydrogenase, cytoplasmic n=1 Tax=Anabrus simplex TaxID=316456 RepID=UPI0034DD8BB9